MGASGSADAAEAQSCLIARRGKQRDTGTDIE